MSKADQRIVDAAKDWWLHFTTPDRCYTGGWRQSKDMVRKRRRLMEDALRSARSKPADTATMHPLDERIAETARVWWESFVNRADHEVQRKAKADMHYALRVRYGAENDVRKELRKA